MSENLQIVRDFIQAWSTLDAQKLAGYFADDGCYHNIPLQPVVGRQKVQDFIQQFIAGWTETQWDITNIAATGNLVMVERLDRTRTAKGDVDLPCVGVFEMEDGKIKVWRDYFDLATYTRAMQS
ncbi:SgcJ/EcaC family oxidoreductase [Proteobacteria bacterium 005FR1]|nr:SgcJ/EcaC family oxidoreductase [Proteobacteria bacterium 005FR1]